MQYSAKIFVRGEVHGVSFRAFAKKNADIMGLHGYAKNVDKGVEVFVEGDKDNIETFAEGLNNGPGTVRKVEIEWSPASKLFKDFKVIY